MTSTATISPIESEESELLEGLVGTLSSSSPSKRDEYEVDKLSIEGSLVRCSTCIKE